MKKTAAPGTRTRKTPKRAPSRGVSPKPPAAGISPEERHRMIAEAAYYKCLQRGPGNQDPEADWLAAEAEIDQRLNAAGEKRRRGSAAGGQRPRKSSRRTAGSR